MGAFFFGLVGTVLGVLNYHNDREAEQRHLQLEATDLLNQAWDLMGGKPGTTTIPTNQFSSPEDLELAHRLIERALKLAETGKAYSLKATYLLATERLDEAKEAALQAIELEPEHAPAHTSLGIVLREEGNLHESVQVLRQAVRLDGDAVGRCCRSHTFSPRWTVRSSTSGTIP